MKDKIEYPWQPQIHIRQSTNDPTKCNIDFKLNVPGIGDAGCEFTNEIEQGWACVIIGELTENLPKGMRLQIWFNENSAPPHLDVLREFIDSFSKLGK